MTDMINCVTTTGEPSLAQTANRVRGAARLDLVKRALAAGKSRRKIARELGYDEGTIRRDLKILALPEHQVLAIRNGATAEKFLRARRRQEAAEQRELRWQQAAEAQRIRLQEEKASGINSDETAKAVLGWLMTKDLLPPDKEMILNMVDYWSWSAGDQQVLPWTDPKRVFLSCERGRPPDEMGERLDFYVTILRSALFLLAPELAIRDSAIKKARIALCPPWIRLR